MVQLCGVVRLLHRYGFTPVELGTSVGGGVSWSTRPKSTANEFAPAVVENGGSESRSCVVRSSVTWLAGVDDCVPGVVYGEITSSGRRLPPSSHTMKIAV